MRYFITNMVDDKELKEKLRIAIGGPGAFRRFKEVLANYSGETQYQQAWFDFYNDFVWNESMDFLTALLSKDKNKATASEIQLDVLKEEHTNNATDGRTRHDFVQINDVNYPVYIEETATKTSYAKVQKDIVLISISSHLNNEEKKRVIERLKTRIQHPKRTRFIEPLREFKDGDIIDLGDKKYNVKIDFVYKQSSSGKLVGNVIHLRIGSEFPEEYKKKHAYELVRKILSKHRQSYLKQKLKELNKHHFNAKFRDVKWNRQMSKWGSCTSDKDIYISYRLLFAPEDVLEYVCIHELAHLIVFNHKERFWKLVKKAMPDYEEKEQWLKENGVNIF